MLASVKRDLAKARAVFAIWLQEGIAYRASAIIWVLTDAANAITMPLVWAAAAGSGVIAGYNAQEFVGYYLSMLLISSFVTCHFMWEVAFEIKEGYFSIYLIRPIDYMWFMLIRNFAWRIVRTVVFLPLFFVVLFGYQSFLSGIHLQASPLFWISLLLGHLVSFGFVMAFSMIALFITEARSVFELYYVPMLFLSGQLFPIALLPDWARNLAMLFPFYYTTGVPTEILVGRLSGNAAYQMVGLQFLWLVGSLVVQRLLWRQGLKHYSAVGM